jgi:RNA polymerase sigma-70 factor (ECF subfamily)
MSPADPAPVVATDERSFTAAAERHRRELHIHCYRMLASFHEAEDAVQETYLRAWRARDTFDGGRLFRAWLYRIATNVCLDALRRRSRQLTKIDSFAEVAWLEPYPDRLLDEAAAGDEGPDERVVDRETISLTFLTAMQVLPPKQRAALIARDVLGWSAAETATALDLTVVAVKSALQRARPTLRAQLPQRRMDWAATAAPAEKEQELLRRFMDAHERADAAALAELLREDVWMTMPPLPFWFVGRASVVAFAENSSPLREGQWRGVLTRANRQPALAGYLRLPGQREYHAQMLNVLRVADEQIAEITVFEPHVFAAFGLLPTLA